MKKKVKEKWITGRTIKFKTLLQTTEFRKDCYANKELLINVKISDGLGSVSSSFATTKTGTKEILKFIKNNVYLK